MGTLVITHEAGKNIRLNVNGGDWTPRSSTETTDTYLVLQGGVFNVFEGNRIVMRFFNEEQRGFYVREVSPAFVPAGQGTEMLEVTLRGENLDIFGSEQPKFYWSTQNDNPLGRYVDWSSRFDSYDAQPGKIVFVIKTNLSNSKSYLGALEYGGEIVWINNSRPL